MIFKIVLVNHTNIYYYIFSLIVNFGENVILNINVGITVAILFTLATIVIFCSYFSARLAQLKGRNKVWGILGLLFGIFGLIIVCCIPSKRKDNLQTNPIASLFSKMPPLSAKTAIIVICICSVTIITFIVYDNVPTLIDNYKYSQKIIQQNNSEIVQQTSISGEVNDIFVGSESTYIILSNGDVYCFGKQLSDVTDKEKNIIYSNAKKVLSNNELIFILDNNNCLYAKGNNRSKLINIENENVEEFTLIAENVTDFSLSESTLGIIKTDGKLYMCGENNYGQLSTYNHEFKANPIPVLGSVKSVHCESTFTVALQKSGDAVVFGNNSNGQFGIEGDSFFSPNAIQHNVIDIAAGDNFILLLKENGELISCGGNEFGQLGNTTNASSAIFAPIMQNVKTISAAKGSAYAITNEGDLYAWGLNNLGQLGIGNTDNVNTPTPSVNNVKSVKTSGLHTVIITTENKILSVGNNTYNQLGKGSSRTTFSELVSIKN